MGCDIHTVVERKVDGKYEAIPGFEPFDWRSYFMYGFLADVRNYSDVPPLAKPRGLPDDVSEEVRELVDVWGMDGHSHSWLSVAELLDFRYDERVEDRRVTVQTGPNSWDGGATAAPGGGALTTWREALGTKYFEDLSRLSDEGAERVVFWFDN